MTPVPSIIVVAEKAPLKKHRARNRRNAPHNAALEILEARTFLSSAVATVTLQLPQPPSDAVLTGFTYGQGAGGSTGNPGDGGAITSGGAGTFAGGATAINEIGGLNGEGSTVILGSAGSSTISLQLATSTLTLGPPTFGGVINTGVGRLTPTDPITGGLILTGGPVAPMTVDYTITGPSGTVAPFTPMVFTVTAAARDGYDLDGKTVSLLNGTTALATATFKSGTATFSATALVGSYSYSANIDFTVPAPSTPGETVTVSINPDGSYTYYFPDSPPITVPLGGTPPINLVPGPTPEIHYTGTGNTLDVNVPKSATNTTLKLSQNNVLTLTVTGSDDFSPAPTGQISLFDNGQPLKVIGVTDRGITIPLGVGAHSITASYSGDAQLSPLPPRARCNKPSPPPRSPPPPRFPASDNP